MLNISLKLHHADLLKWDVFGFSPNVCIKSDSNGEKTSERRNLRPSTRAQWIRRDAQPLVLLPFSGHRGTGINYWVRALAVSLSRTAAVGMKPGNHQAGSERTWNLLKGCWVVSIPWGTHILFFSLKIAQIECKGNVNWVVNKSC